MNEKYFKHYDFYNMSSKDFSENGILLEKFKTIQQTGESTCGPICAQMILNYYGDSRFSESEISSLMKTRPYPLGTKFKDIVNFFHIASYKTFSHLDAIKDENGLSFSTFEDFKNFVLLNLKNGLPIMVENVDYGGHYKVIIGYDEQKCSDEDMLIFADPYDVNDGNTDGYNYFPADRFFYMWFDDHCLAKSERKQPFIVVNKR